MDGLAEAKATHSGLKLRMEGAASGDPKARTLVLGRPHYHL
jgi:hypothetical protein